MQKVKIFLASSEELREERIMFGDFINGLRRSFEPMGKDLELVKWEDLDSAYNGRCKEDEYIDQIKKCQLFVALFHTKAGMYTQQELEAARRSLETFNVPAILIFMKDVRDGEERTKELKQLNDKILKEWKHFNDTYNHLDTLKLRFLQQLIIKLNDPTLRLDVADSVVRFNNTPVANLDNVPFAANNEHYQELKKNLEDANKKIEAYEQVLSATDNTVIEGLLNQEKKRRAELHQQLAQYEKDLFVTSQRIASLKSKHMNDRLRKAIELFESGDNKGTEALLDMKDIKLDVRWLSDNADVLKENAYSVISQLVLKAQNLLTLYDNPNRIDEADQAYALALDVTQKIKIDEEDLIELFGLYQKFLFDYAHYDRAEEIAIERVRTSEFVYGDKHQLTALSYNDIADIYNEIGQNDKALEYYEKALSIVREVNGGESSNAAAITNNIGNVYKSQGDYEQALDYYISSLMIFEKILSPEDPNIAITYNNIGDVYNYLGEYTHAMKCYFDALEIQQKVLGREHPDTAYSYHSIADIYDSIGEYDKALEFYGKALNIRQKLFGHDNPNTAFSYNGIGTVYSNKGEWDNALSYYSEALKILETIFDKEHVEIAKTANNMGTVYERLQQWDKAFEYYGRAIHIYENTLGHDNRDTAISYLNIGALFHRIDYNEKALEYLNISLEIMEKVLGTTHPLKGDVYNNLGSVYEDLKEYDTAKEYYQKAVEIYEKVFDNPHPNAVLLYKHLGIVYENLLEYDKAIEQYEKALTICEDVFGEESFETVEILDKLADAYGNQNEYVLAIVYYTKALEIRKKLFGTDHPETANSYNYIGYAYLSMEEPEMAFKYFKMALEIFEKILDANHPAMLSLLWNIAQSLENQGEMKEARSYMQRLSELGDEDAIKWIEDHKDMDSN